MTPRIAAVLVNFNSGDELRTALRSIASELTEAWEAVVVDNASTDGSGAAALEFTPQVRLFRNAKNVGFGSAVNQAIAATHAPLVLIMNPDCRLVSGAIAPLIEARDQEPRCAVVAPRILDPDGSPQGNARGDPDMLTGFFGRTGVLRRAWSGTAASRRNVIDEPAGGPPVVVDWVSGACMLARRAALAQIGGFDERYFMYWEDADMCRRLRNRGYVIRYVPAATAVHRVGQSSRTARAASIRAFHDSAYRYYGTHVAPGAVSPRRWLARMLLSLRCWWKLREVPPGT